jgi:ABC-type transport system involved in multi-copper enzyme maturation permease subunit
MFLRLLAIEIRKTLKLPALWIGLSALSFLLALIILNEHAQIANGYQPASGGLEQDLLTGLSYYTWIGILVYAVTASVIAASDYPDRSIQLWLTKGVPRSMLLLARLTVILFFGLLMVVMTFIAILVLASLSRLIFFSSVDASNLNPLALLPTILRIYWSSLPYLALTMLFAVISRSPFFAAGGTIIYGTVLESILMRLGDRFPTLVPYLPAQLAQVLQIQNVILDRLALLPLRDTAIMPETQAILAIGVTFIILSSVSIFLFSRQDLGG